MYKIKALVLSLVLLGFVAPADAGRQCYALVQEDINHDGRVTAVDAQLVLNASVGLRDITVINAKPCCFRGHGCHGDCDGFRDQNSGVCFDNTEWEDHDEDSGD